MHAGDVIFVSIAETLPGNWLITLQNNTTGQTVQQSTLCTSSYATAEWIEERGGHQR